MTTASSQNQKTALLIGLEEESVRRLLEALPQLPMARVAPEPSAVAEALSRHTPKSAVVAFGGEASHERDLSLVAQLALSGVAPLVIGPHREADTILEAMRAGARDYIVSGEESRLTRMLQGGAPGNASFSSRVIALFGAKGGVGATTLALQLAGLFREGGQRVCLVEGSGDFDDLHASLDLKEGFTAAELLQNLDRLDDELLDTSLSRHASGVLVIRSGDLLSERSSPSPEEWGRILAFLRRHFDRILLDGMKGFGEVSLALLDAADDLLLVVSPELLAIRNTQGAVELFRRIGYADAKLKLILNRFESGGPISPALIEESIGLPIAAALAADAPALAAALERGVFVTEYAPRSAVSGDLRRLARLWSDAVAPSRVRRTSLLGKLFSRGAPPWG